VNGGISKETRQGRPRIAAARTGALVVPASDRAGLVVTGKDRLTWLNGLVTCDLSKSAPGEAVYGLVVEKKGRILADLVILVEAERLVILAPAAVVDKLATVLDQHLIMEDAAVERGAFEALFAHGPRAGDALAAARALGATGGSFDVTGLGGALIAAAAGTGLIEGLVARATSFGGVIGDDDDWETLRLERGVPRFGVDFDGSMYPQEAALETTAVSFSKGCYMGQEVVYMLEKRGHVKRKLVPFALERGEDGASAPEKGAVVRDAAGAEIGTVSSAVQSPTAHAPVGLAMLKYAHAKAELAIAIDGAKGQTTLRPV
jgi:folate-binding protein YgfZ